VPVHDHRDRPTFRLLVVPGVVVDRWSRVWSQRVPAVALELVTVEAADATALLTAQADAGLVRLPVDRTRYEAIPLYTETTVVVIPRDHLLAAAEDVTLTDLADETLLSPRDDVLDWSDVPFRADPPRCPAATATVMELVAAGGGVLVVPKSLARLHHRRDLTYRTVNDAPTSTVGLAWAGDRYTDLVEQMIATVRGRTANSTRGPAPGATATPPPAPDGSPRPASSAGRRAPQSDRTGRDATPRRRRGRRGR
jgi:DNA-binding transcriptional LysR family regulator